jgi:O-antigen/teichoic acid export membrane protein
LAVPLSNLLWHRFLHARVTGDYAKAGELAAKAAGLLFILLMLICVFSYINAKQIVYIVFSRGAFDEISLALTTQTFQSTIFAAIPIGVASVFGRFLISINHPKYLAIIGVSIAISGLAVIYTAKYYDSSIIIQWHWLIGNFIGLLLCLIIFIKKCKFHISEIYTSVKWLLFVSTVVALSALITPEIIFGIGKIDVLLALILNFSIFITVAFFIAYVSGLLNQIKLFLKLTV